MYPHERSLVAKFKNKPFVLLGVNSDKDRREVKAVVKRERLTWRSWWNDGAPGGPIAREWGVTGWPTLYLIDHTGVIRYKAVGAEDLQKLDKEIALLAKDAGSDLAKRRVEESTKARADKPTKESPRISGEEVDDASKSERLAGSRLKLAKMLAEGGKVEKARERYRDIIAKYPKTDAAVEAKRLLDEQAK
jgi:hypothetical protein